MARSEPRLRARCSGSCIGIDIGFQKPCLSYDADRLVGTDRAVLVALFEGKQTVLFLIN